MTEENQLKLTPTERRLFDLTADGKIHSKNELLSCFDELAGVEDVRNAVAMFRKKLYDIGQDIVFQNGGNISGYRRVRKLTVEID